MIDQAPGAAWRVTTWEIADPGRLDAYLPAIGGLGWLRRGDGIIGIGEAVRLSGASPAEAEQWWREFAAELRPGPGCDPTDGPVVFASFSFDPGHTAQPSVMVVPRIVLRRRQGRSWLTELSPATQPGPTETPDLSALAVLSDLADPSNPTDPRDPADPTGNFAPAARLTVRLQPGPPIAAPEVRVAERSLDREAWQCIVAEAVRRIETDGLDKVVLARSVTLRATEPLDQRRLFSTLAERYPTCWTYRVDRLIGASPEMLVRLQDGLAMSRVLAGTIRRDGSEELDLKLAHSLARSSKNLVEHELAVASVATALAPFCSGMNVPDAPYVLELPNVLHLASDVTAVAHQGVSALRLAAELHPSAAVCGTPTATARATIAELEQLDRDRYSGPVGWMDAHGDGEFAIALRCGLIDPDDPCSISLFAGCGIVAESDPAEEYAETEAKLVPMLEALGVEPPARH